MVTFHIVPPRFTVGLPFPCMCTPRAQEIYDWAEDHPEVEVDGALWGGPQSIFIDTVTVPDNALAVMFKLIFSDVIKTPEQVAKEARAKVAAAYINHPPLPRPTVWKASCGDVATHLLEGDDFGCGGHVSYLERKLLGLIDAGGGGELSLEPIGPITIRSAVEHLRFSFSQAFALLSAGILKLIP